MRNVAISNALRNVKECHWHLTRLARRRNMTRADDIAAQHHAANAHAWRSLWLNLNTKGGRHA
ncbi:hypothetical protein [Aeromonas hydrophila]|uniref:hypothetical protein n=1 Tax=Aeromonas hydrophila TaxID=644 RepID=UPI002B484D92|nr:hypothetical protein [Aeromonas hydrophila]